MTSLRFGAHIPWSQIESSLDRVLDLGLIPEIAIKGPEFDILDQASLRKRYSNPRRKTVYRPFVHAPFFDLNAGALDPLIRQVTQQSLFQALSFASQLNAHLMVIHPGVDKWRYPNLDQTGLLWQKASFHVF